MTGFVFRKSAARSVGSQEASAFARAAADYVRKSTSSPQAAHKRMVSLGIHTQKGELTKTYKK
jgi:hypothetical protein